jgi:hypothetical protein
MTFAEFTNWSLAQGTVCKTDGTFCGECVSLINQYLSKVHGINAGAWGHAKDWANTSNPIRQWFTPVNQSQAGDIGISGAVSGNPYGHIWIYRDKDILEQNGRVARKVTISPDRNALVILRPKAGMPQSQGVDMISRDQVKDLYRVFLGREAGDNEAQGWVGDWARAFYGIKDSAEGQAYRAKQAAEKAVAEAQRGELTKAREDLATATKALEDERAKQGADQEKVKQANLLESFVQLIKGLWSK